MVVLVAFSDAINHTNNIAQVGIIGNALGSADAYGVVSGTKETTT
ncbi:MAG: hypothetical protein ACLR5T_03925 [Veillonella sp.]